MAQTYTPLVVVDALSKNGTNGFESFKHMFRYIDGIESVTKDEILQFFTNRDFMCNPPSKTYQIRTKTLAELENTLIRGCYDLFKIAGYSDRLLNADNFSPSAEIRDLLFTPILIEEWSRYKQVYKPDRDFADALLKTAKLQISRHMVSHLPCNLFYIDVSDCPPFGDICGVFVYVRNTDKDCRISMLLTTSDLSSFSFYLVGSWMEDGLLSVDADSIIDIDSKQHDNSLHVLSIFGQNANDFTYNASENGRKLSRVEIHLFVLQMISYLSMDEPQLSDSPLTKGTYRPRPAGAPIKNKWSEVKIEDVGIVYGKSFRKQLEDIKKDSEDSNDTDTDDKPRKHRKSPSPHLRSAHWHRYWVGKGRTDCKVNWIEPKFIGAKSASKNIVIHKVD